MRRVLTDLQGFAQLNVVEGQEGGTLIAEGKVGQCDVPTANGRVYPRTVMEREINRLQPRIEHGSIISAVDHPGDGKTRIKESGAIMRGLWIEPNGEIHGRFEVVEEAPAGQALAAFLRRGAQIGMSSRGMGSTIPGPKGQDIVGEDYKLNTWDFVSDPACKDAYPAIMSEDEEAEITEDHLRARFPSLVRSIEENAYRTAQEVVEAIETDRIRSEIEQQAESAIEQGSDALKETVKVEVYDEAFKQLREDFAVKLVRTIAEMRGEIEEEVKSELASDPAVAGAKGVLKRIAEMVHPFTPPPDMRRSLQEKDEVAEELQAQINKVQRQLEQQSARSSALEEKGRQLAYALYIEKSISGRTDADALREMIGDVDDFRSVADLRARVEGIIAQADEVHAEAESEVDTIRDGMEARMAEVEAKARARIAEADARADRAAASEARIEGIVEQRTAALEEKIAGVLATKDEEIAGLRKQLYLATEQLEAASQRISEANDADDLAKLLTYAVERTQGHPRAKQIVSAVSSGKLLTEDQIDKIASRYEDQAHGPGGVRERVRRAFAYGQEAMTEDQRVQHDVEESAMMEEFGEAAADLRDLGTSLNEQQGLAGIHRPQRR